MTPQSSTASPPWAREAGDPALERLAAALEKGPAAPLLGEARALARAQGSDGARAGRSLALGIALRESKSPASAREAARVLADAAELAEKVGARATLAEARLQAALANLDAGEFAAALAGLEAVTPQGDDRAIARHRTALATARAATGDRKRAVEDLFAASAALGRAEAPPQERARPLVLATAIARRSGDLEAARRAAIAARAAIDETQDAGERALARTVEAELRSLAGDLDSAIKTAEAALELARGAANRAAGARALVTVGACRLDSGDARVARDLLDRAARAAAPVDVRSAYRASALHALACAAAGDAESAREALAGAVSLCEETKEVAVKSGRTGKKHRPLDEEPAPLEDALAEEDEPSQAAIALATAAASLAEGRIDDAIGEATEAAQAAEAASAWDLALRARELIAENARGGEAIHAARELERLAKARSAPLWVAAARVVLAREGEPVESATLRDAASVAERRGALPLARAAYEALARVAAPDVATWARERATSMQTATRPTSPRPAKPRPKREPAATAPAHAPPPTAPKPPADEDSLEREDLLRLARLLPALATAIEPETALGDVVDAAVELTGARRGLVYLLGPRGAFVLAGRGRGAAPLDPKEEVASSTIVRAAVGENATIATADASRDDRFSKASSVAALGSVAVLCAPLAVRGKTIGALYLDAPGAAPSFDDRARALLARFSAAASLAVGAARERRLLDRVLDAPLELDALLDAALGLLLEATGAVRGRIVEVPDDDTDAQPRVRAAHAADGSQEAPVPLGLVREAVKFGAPILVVDDDPRASTARIAAPISAGGRAIAVVLLEHPDAHALSSYDRDLVGRVARKLARPLANALVHSEVAREGEAARTALRETLRKMGERDRATGIVGEDPAIVRALDLVARVRDLDVPILIRGESGTGKELFARAIHHGGKRAARPFIAQACGGLGGPLLESELFGHEKGAFTGAEQARVGLFEAANGGTLLLDEIADLTPEVQAKLLRVLEAREVRPLGSATSRKVDVRVMATTRLEIDALKKAIREDLYYRLTTVAIDLPPLRKRRDDIASLANAFIEKICGAAGEKPRKLTPGALRVLVQHDWPGNVRELENSISRAIALSSATTISQDDFQLERVAASVEDAPEEELSKRQEKAVRAARDGKVLTAASYVALVRVSKRTAIRDLNELVDKGWLVRAGRGSSVSYTLAQGR